MPSSELAHLSQQIENMQTDSLGKFYIYAALLHSITVRDEQKTFDSLLPTDNRITSAALNIFGGRKLDLHTDSSQILFREGITAYRKQFDYKPSVLDVLDVTKKIVLTYFRRSQLGDLAFINERMLSHLEMLPKALTQNQSIYDSTGFKSMQPKIKSLLQSVKDVHTNGFSIVDNGAKTVASLVLAMLGLIAVVSLTHIFFGLIMLASGGACAWVFSQQTERSFMQMSSLIQACADNAKNLYIESQGLQTGDTDIFSKAIERATEDTLQKSFLVESIIKPLSYVPIVFEELTSLGDDSKELKDKRDALDNQFSM